MIDSAQDIFIKYQYISTENVRKYQISSSSNTAGAGAGASDSDTAGDRAGGGNNNNNNNKGSQHISRYFYISITLL